MMDGVNVTLNGEREAVARETVYTPKKEDTVEKSLTETVKGILHDFFGKKEFNPDTDQGVEVPIIKQFVDEEMVAIEPLYCPPNVADGHGEGMNEEDIRKMVDSANGAIERGDLSAGLFHAKNTDKIEILKTWVNECDCVIGGTTVVEGQPIAKVKFHDSKLWEMRKSGDLGGLTIGAKGKRVPND